MIWQYVHNIRQNSSILIYQNHFGSVTTSRNDETLMEEIIFPQVTPVFPDVTTETIYKIATSIFQVREHMQYVMITL